MKNIPEDVKYIIWTNHISEGWSMTMFQKWDEVQEWIFKGESYGNEYVVTRPIRFDIKEAGDE